MDVYINSVNAGSMSMQYMKFGKGDKTMTDAAVRALECILNTGD